MILVSTVKAATRNFHIVLIWEAPVDKGSTVSTVISTKYNVRRIKLSH